MAYQVFLSHSMKDKHLVDYLRTHIQPMGAEVYVAAYDPRPGTQLSDKIARAIDTSDCVVVVLTSNASNSQWVNQEIGYAKKAGKPVLPFVEKGVSTTAFLEAREWISFDP